MLTGRLNGSVVDGNSEGLLDAVADNCLIVALELVALVDTAAGVVSPEDPVLKHYHPKRVAHKLSTHNIQVLSSLSLSLGQNINTTFRVV